MRTLLLFLAFASLAFGQQIAVKTNSAGALIIPTTLSIPSGATFAASTGSTVNIGVALTFTDGIKQTFNPSGTNAGINVGAHTADPSAPVNGDLFYDSDDNLLRAYIGGAWVSLGAGGGGSVATDAIWDAAGDIVQGAGANTAARLAIGTAGQPLKVNAGATAVEYGTLGYAGGGTNATTQAAARANLGGMQYGFANGAAVLAATPEYAGQPLYGGGYLGIGTGTGAGNVTGLLVAGAGTIYAQNTWEFQGNITQQGAYTSQLHALTITSGGISVTSGNVTLSNGTLYQTKASGQCAIFVGSSSDALMEVRSSASTAPSALEVRTKDDLGGITLLAGNSASGAPYQGKLWVDFFFGLDDGTSDGKTAPIIFQRFGKYSGAIERHWWIGCDSDGNTTFYRHTDGVTDSSCVAAVTISAAGLLTATNGFTVSSGTITLGSGTGVAMLASGVLSADTTPDLGTPSAVTLTNGTGLPVAGITSSTSTALGVGSIELGHASDTTITRVSAGVIAVEGVTLAGSPLTTKGDIYTYSTANARLGVGANGTVLTADSAETTGLKWQAVAGTGDVTAAAVITDNRIVRGDGGAKGVQESTVAIDDSGNITGTGDVTIGGGVTRSSIIFLENSGNGSNSINIRAPAAVTTTTTFNLPDGDGTSGYVLSTNGSGALSWIANGGGVVDNTIASGRLTLTTATPVLTSTVSAAGTLYFTPYKGNRIALYNGSTWEVLSFSELSITLSTLSAATQYDIWAYNNAGSVALDSTAWTNTTTRATALAYQDGVRCKTGALTRRYLGTIYVDGSQQCNVIFGAGAAGGTAGQIDVWNENNRVHLHTTVSDTTDSWNYSTNAWQATNASTTNRVTFIQGVADDTISARAYSSSTTNNASTQLRWTGIGLDSTSAVSGLSGASGSTTAGGRAASSAEYSGAVTGRHYIQWLEKASATGTTTWYGDNAADGTQTGLVVELTY